MDLRYRETFVDHLVSVLEHQNVPVHFGIRLPKCSAPQPIDAVEALIENLNKEDVANFLSPEDLATWVEEYRWLEHRKRLATKVFYNAKLSTSDRKLIYEALTGYAAPRLERTKGRKPTLRRDLTLAKTYLELRHAGKSASAIRGEIWKTIGLPSDDENGFNKALRKGMEALYAAARLTLEYEHLWIQECHETLTLIFEYTQGKKAFVPFVPGII